MAASASGRRPASRKREPGHGGAAREKRQPAAAAERDEIAERAATLGVTVERVLQEYARIAFADLSRLIEWGPKGFVVKESGDLSENDTAAISEISATGSKKAPHRVKLYDKRAALDAIARHLGMFQRVPAAAAEGAPGDLAEDAREVLARRLARLVAGGAETPSDRGTDGTGSGGAQP